MNNVVLVGNLTKDPEMTTSGDSSRCRFTIAVQRTFKNSDGNYDADFIPCVSFGKTAEFISKYFSKGRKIAITGEIRTGSYKKDNGETVFTTNVVVNNTEFVTPKGSDGESKGEAVDHGFVNVPEVDEDALPFN